MAKHHPHNKNNSVLHPGDGSGGAARNAQHQSPQRDSLPSISVLAAIIKAFVGDGAADELIFAGRTPHKHALTGHTHCQLCDIVARDEGHGTRN